MKEIKKGTFIAVDKRTGKICGSGSTLTEAAKAAIRKYPDKKFDFKRAGYPYTASILFYAYIRIQKQ